MRRKVLVIIAGVTLALAGAPAYAVTDHSTHTHSHEGQEMHEGVTVEMPEGMSVKTLKIDGYSVTFEIWDISAYSKMMRSMNMEPLKPEPGTTHHIAVIIRKGDMRMDKAAVKIKLITPDNKSETKMLTYNPDQMSQYVGRFNMAQQGKYQVMTLFKIEGRKHKGGYWHEKR